MARRHLAVGVKAVALGVAVAALGAGPARAQPVVERDGKRYAVVPDRLVLTLDHRWRIDTQEYPIGDTGRIATPPVESIDTYTELPDGTLGRGVLVGLAGDAPGEADSALKGVAITERDGRFAVTATAEALRLGPVPDTARGVVMAVPAEYASPIVPQAESRAPNSDLHYRGVQAPQTLAVIPARQRADRWGIEVPVSAVQGQGDTPTLETTTIDASGQRLASGVPTAVELVSTSPDGQRRPGFYVVAPADRPTSAMWGLTVVAVVAPGLEGQRVVTQGLAWQRTHAPFPAGATKPLGTRREAPSIFTRRDRWTLWLSGMHESFRPRAGVARSPQDGVWYRKAAELNAEELAQSAHLAEEARATIAVVKATEPDSDNEELGLPRSESSPVRPPPPPATARRSSRRSTPWTSVVSSPGTARDAREAVASGPAAIGGRARGGAAPLWAGPVVRA